MNDIAPQYTHTAIPTTHDNAERYLFALDVPEVKLPISHFGRVVTNLGTGERVLGETRKRVYIRCYKLFSFSVKNVRIDDFASAGK